MLSCTVQALISLVFCDFNYLAMIMTRYNSGEGAPNRDMPMSFSSLFLVGLQPRSGAVFLCGRRSTAPVGEAVRCQFACLFVCLLARLFVLFCFVLCCVVLCLFVCLFVFVCVCLFVCLFVVRSALVFIPYGTHAFD